MAVPNSTTPVEQMTNVNEDLIAGLREAADFLEAHPELPRFNAHLGSYPSGRAAREQMNVVAAALGEKATEGFAYDRQVEIRGRFGERVVLAISTHVEYLGTLTPPTPIYEPIIKRAS